MADHLILGFIVIAIIVSLWSTVKGGGGEGDSDRGAGAVNVGRGWDLGLLRGRVLVADAVGGTAATGFD